VIYSLSKHIYNVYTHASLVFKLVFLPNDWFNNGVYAVPCNVQSFVQAELVRYESACNCAKARIAWGVLHAVSERMQQMFILIHDILWYSYYIVYLQWLMWVSKRFTRIEPLLRNACVGWVLCRERPMQPWFVAAGAHAKAWHQISWQRGSVSRWPAAGRERRVDWFVCLIGRVSRCADFKTALILSDEMRRQSREHPCSEARTKGREDPSLTLSGGKAGNARTLRKDDGRERSSHVLNRDKAGNAWTLRKDESRERSSLQWSDSKAENARAFAVRSKEPRTPVLF